jgi:DNA repair protein RadC
MRNRAAREAADMVPRRIRRAYQEHLVVLSLNVRAGCLGVDTVSIGTLDANLVHPREVFAVAIRRHAAYIVVVHNHPSGDVEPSANDIEVTKRLITAGQILGIAVLDHLIVARDAEVSLRERGVVEFPRT